MMRKMVSMLLSAGVSIILFSGAFAESGDIAINAKNFPDKGLRKGVMESCDINGDNVVSISERKQIPGIAALDHGVSDATGIGLFPEMANLDLGWNKLKKLDLSGNPKLEFVDLDHNDITSINLSNSVSLVNLSAPDNKLASLDLSNCPNLQTLYIPNNKLTAIDTSNNPLLEQLVINNNGLKLNFLDVTHNSKLFRLETQGNSIKAIDISGCPLLIKRTKEFRPYRDVGGVSWETDLVVDKNTILTNNGDPVYIPEMYPFLREWGETIFPGFADETDIRYPAVVTKSCKAYSDQNRKHSIGTIPSYTAVIVSPTSKDSTYKVLNYGGQECYVASSSLWGMKTVSPNWAYLKLDKAVTVYQQPDMASTSVRLKKGTNIAVVSEKDSWFLIRAVDGNNDMYCFVQGIM